MNRCFASQALPLNLLGDHVPGLLWSFEAFLHVSLKFFVYLCKNMCGKSWTAILCADKYEWPFKDTVINSLSSQCQKLLLEKCTDSHCLSILVFTFMKNWWVIERDAFDRGKILSSRKSSLSWPTSLEKQQQKSYLSKLQFALQHIVLELVILRTKSKETLIEFLPSSSVPWCLTFLKSTCSSPTQKLLRI